MNGHVSSLSQRFAYFPHRLRGISPRGRHTSVLHWERQEEEPARLSKVRLRTKLQVFVFLRCEKRDHGIHSGFSPTRDLVFQPVAPTGPRRDCELARPGAVNPIKLRVHSDRKRDHGIPSGFSPTRDLVFQPVAPTGPRRDCELARPGAVNPIKLRVHSSYPSADSSLFSHDYLAWKSVHIDCRDLKTLMRWFPSRIVPSGLVLSQSFCPGKRLFSESLLKFG